MQPAVPILKQTFYVCLSLDANSSGWQVKMCGGISSCQINWGAPVLLHMHGQKPQMGCKVQGSPCVKDLSYSQGLGMHYLKDLETDYFSLTGS